MSTTAGPPVYPMEDQGPAILAATLTMTGVALLTLALRLYVRVGMIGNMGWDDYTMIITMITVLAGQGVIIPEVIYGAGKHITHIPPEHIPIGLKLNFVTQPIFLWSISLVKISIGFFLLRIATKPLFRRLISGIMIFMVIYTFVCFMTIIFQCSPISMLWAPTPEGKCFAPTTLRGLSYINVALSITTDLTFAVFIPIPMLWDVQLNNRTKASLVCILGLGVFASAAAIVKAAFIASYGKTGDWLWDSRNLTIWTVTEACVGIIAGNLPTLKPLFHHALSLSSYGRSKATPYGYATGPSYGDGTRKSRRYSTIGSRNASGAPVYVGKAGGGGVDGDETHMMTRVSARGVPAGSDKNATSDATSEVSEESVMGLDAARGITKTTTTKISFGGPAVGAFPPERRVEDRV